MLRGLFASDIFQKTQQLVYLLQQYLLWVGYRVLAQKWEHFREHAGRKDVELRIKFSKQRVKRDEIWSQIMKASWDLEFLFASLWWKGAH